MSQSGRLENVTRAPPHQVEEKLGSGLAVPPGASSGEPCPEANLMPSPHARVQSDKPSEDNSHFEGCAAALGLEEEQAEARATAELWGDHRKSRDDPVVVKEEERFEIEQVQQEEPAEVPRTQEEPATMRMDHPNVQRNFVWAEEDVAGKDVENQPSRPEHIPLAKEDERLQTEHVHGEEQAELLRAQAELATTWMDLQKCRNDLVWAEKELAENDVENQQLGEELRKCREDLARVQREREQLRQEKREESEKVPSPLSHASREQQVALQRAHELLAKERTRFSDTLRENQEAVQRGEEERMRFLDSLREKDAAIQRAEEELARLRASTVAGQICHLQLADGTLTSFRLPLHWIAQGRDLVRQIGQRVTKENSDSSSFPRRQVAGPEPGLTFEIVAQRMANGSVLEKFTKLLRDSVFHFGDWMSTFGHATCSALKSRIEVCEAYHVENVPLYKAYQDHCQQMQLKHSVRGVVLQPISPEPNPAISELALQMGVQMWAPNEHLLFHGTSSDAAGKIALEGFDIVGARSGLYGKGAYFAAQSCKSHQYADQGQDLHTMIIARVALGDPYYCNNGNPSCVSPPAKFDGGPCCDSLIAQPGRMPGHFAGHQTHAEFIVFEPKQVYPEYILKYRLSDV